MNETKNKKVLIIEDDPLNLKLENLLFEKAGYTVFQAMNGEDGIKIALEITPDLMVIDYLLPGISGLDVLNKIKDDGETIRNIPCVIVTAAATENDINKFKESRAHGYILKPINTQTFVNEIEKIVSGQ